jgi:hypothetical protein
MLAQGIEEIGGFGWRGFASTLTMNGVQRRESIPGRWLKIRGC